MMEKKYARLAALLTAAVLCGNGAPSMADDLVGKAEDGWSIVIDNGHDGNVYGNKDHPDTTGAVTGHVEMTGGTVNGEIYGGYSNGGAVTGSTVTITGGTVNGDVYGGWSKTDTATGNTVTIGGIACWNVFGGYSNEGAATSNTVTISDGTETGYVYGGYSNGGAVTGNTVTIGGIAGGNVFGGYSDMNAATGNTVTISDGTVTGYVYGGYSYRGASTISGNTVTITSGSTVENSVYGGYSNGGSATYNTVTITGGEVTGDICGGWGNTDATGNTVTITSGSTVKNSVYGGYSVTGAATDNTVALLGSADVKEASLYGGSNKAGTDSENTLLIKGWTGSKVKDVQNFSDITFQNIQWQTDGTVLDITNAGNDGELSGTSINVENLVLANGTHVRAGDKMTFIQSHWDTGLSLDKVNVTEDASFSQGVATVGELEMKLEGETNNLVGEIKGVGLNPQTTVIAENRAAGAAFVNQGADIAADSLRLLDDGYHFGTQTFGAVYGNRSTYDVAGDFKINGWSEIAGFGNIHEVKGGRLAWGVFYENGTGNYRTWNTFNNEMFRGDGSLLYNGGGAAVRLTKDSGMYYEASLRAGTLSSSMTDAVRDGYGNSYGFDSDSTYWGGHIGAGKLIQRGSGQWDIYGKYFHTDIDGDSFEMGGDRFSFDDVTSDRLRLGARYTADTDKAWSLYCGAAYEYEFSGDSRMKAGQFEAPEQSLQGSTVFGEIGTVWGRKDSPWSMDVNLRGYAGEREGFSGMVQLAYAF